MIYRIDRTQHLDCTIEEAWNFFSNPKNLSKLTPDSIGFRITHCTAESIHAGQTIGYKIKIAPFAWVNWLTEITQVQDQQSFVDDQRVGPYKVWHHTHKFAADGDGVSMTDQVVYVMPFGIIGRLVHWLFVRKKLRYIFDERLRLCHSIFNAKNVSAT